MLVLSKQTKNYNVEGQWEPIHKFKDRVGNDAAQLLEAIAEINLYLPDDWRMTRRENQFCILVVPASGNSYKLVGRSYRLNDSTILHIIESVFKPHFFDQYDLRAAGEEAGRKGVDRNLKVNNPEIIQPNLYFFQPSPDDSASPLFARQYEKIKLDVRGKPAGRQYHRIHPLHKWGLDLDHYKWVKWDINGNVQFIDYPEPGYHGKDYWLIPSLEGEQRRGRKDEYVTLLHDLMREFNVTMPQPPELSPTPYEQEYKLLAPAAAGQPTDIFKRAKEILKVNGLTGHGEKSRDQIDTYFDDDKLCLLNRGASFRFRETKGSARVTLKVRQNPVSTEVNPPGEYRRMEEEVTISMSQKESLFRGEIITALPYRLVPYIAPEIGKLKPVVTVKTNREFLEVKNKDLQKAEVCFDIVHYTVGGKTFGPDIEIEIESKGLPREDIAIIAAVLQSDLNLVPSGESKYERAINLR